MDDDDDEMSLIRFGALVSRQLYADDQSSVLGGGNCGGANYASTRMPAMAGPGDNNGAPFAAARLVCNDLAGSN